MRGNMRDKIGIFLREKEDGSIDVQLFADPVKLAEMFKNLKGNIGEEPTRATMLALTFEDGKAVVEAESKDLPVEPVPAEERPDGIVLGKGPIHLPKKEEDDG
jgi:hypothetical protein